MNKQRITLKKHLQVTGYVPCDRKSTSYHFFYDEQHQVQTKKQRQQHCLISRRNLSLALKRTNSKQTTRQEQDGPADGSTPLCNVVFSSERGGWNSRRKKFSTWAEWRSSLVEDEGGEEVGQRCVRRRKKFDIWWRLWLPYSRRMRSNRSCVSRQRRDGGGRAGEHDDGMGGRQKMRRRPRDFLKIGLLGLILL